MKRLLLTLALSAAFCSTALAQAAATPDLSGTWKLNLAKSKLDKHNEIKSETITITSKDATIEFHYSTDGKEHTHAYIADGKERRLAEVQGGYVVQKAAWKKSKCSGWSQRDSIASVGCSSTTSSSSSVAQAPPAGGRENAACANATSHRDHRFLAHLTTSFFSPLSSPSYRWPPAGVFDVDVNVARLFRGEALDGEYKKPQV